MPNCIHVMDHTQEEGTYSSGQSGNVMDVQGCRHARCTARLSRSRLSFHIGLRHRKLIGLALRPCSSGNLSPLCTDGRAPWFPKSDI